QLHDARLPRREHLIALAGIRSVAKHAADMTHDDVRARTGARQIDDILELRMKYPGVERKTECRQPCQPRAEVRPPIYVRPARAIADHGIGIPVARMPHSTEPPATGADMCFQHRLNALPQRQ